MFFEKLINQLSELLFPSECLVCKKEGEYLCQNCLGDFALYKNLFCPVCKKAVSCGQVCMTCYPESSLDGVIVALEYDDKVLDSVIHYFKYKGIRSLSKPLGSVLVASLKKIKFWDTDWGIVSVPLFDRRKRSRGFNQSELLVNVLSDSLGLDVLSGVLIRKKSTYSQMRLNKVDRQKNLKNAFEIKGSIEFQNIILVDDVMTSGSTLEECAKTLKKSGVKQVWGLVVARGT